MCLEQFAIDAEIWAYVRRIAQPLRLDEDSLALGLIASAPADYLACEHTAKRMREELFAPSLAPAITYDAWLAEGVRDVTELAAERLAASDGGSSVQPLPDGVLAELNRYVESRAATGC